MTRLIKDNGAFLFVCKKSSRSTSGLRILVHFCKGLVKCLVDVDVDVAVVVDIGGEKEEDGAVELLAEDAGVIVKIQNPFLKGETQAMCLPLGEMLPDHNAPSCR